MGDSSVYVLKLYDRVLVEFSADADEYGRLHIRIIDHDAEHIHLFPMPLMCGATSESMLEWLQARTIPSNRQYVYYCAGRKNTVPMPVTAGRSSSMSALIRA